MQAHLSEKVHLCFPILIICLLILYNASYMRAGANSTGGSNTPNTSLSFSQELNIYSWQYRFFYGRNINKTLYFRLNESFNSSVQETFSKKLWKDEQFLNIGLNHLFSKHWSAAYSLNSTIFSDKLANFDNDVALHSATAKFSYAPHSKINLFFGNVLKMQSQLSQKDHGVGFSVGGSADELDLNGFRNTLALTNSQNYFPERTNSDFQLTYRASRQFSELTADTLILFNNRLVRESYDSFVAPDTIINQFSSDTLIAKRTDFSIRQLRQIKRGVENRLSYPLGRNTIFHMKNGVSSNIYQVSNDASPLKQRDDFGFESGNAIAIAYRSDSSRVLFNWHYRYRARDDNRPREVKPDPFGRFPSVGFNTEDALTGMALLAGKWLSHSDSLGLYVSLNKFQFKTTDVVNPNDHDQLKWQATFSHTHLFSQALKIKWELSSYLKHFVFISRKYSGDNNWNRSLRLSPEIVYRPGSFFFFRQKFSVNAKYQTFDFDDEATSRRNLVNRQFMMHTSLFLTVSPNRRIETDFILELAEQGKLFYNSWKQTLSFSWRNIEIQAMLRQFIGNSMKVGCGASVFDRTRWQYYNTSDGSLKKSVMATHINWGPKFEMIYQAARRLDLVLLGRVQFINSSRSQANSIRNINLNINWLF